METKSPLNPSSGDSQTDHQMTPKGQQRLNTDTKNSSEEITVCYCRGQWKEQIKVPTGKASRDSCMTEPANSPSTKGRHRGPSPTVPKNCAGIHPRYQEFEEWIVFLLLLVWSRYTLSTHILKSNPWGDGVRKWDLDWLIRGDHMAELYLSCQNDYLPCSEP